MPYPRISDFYRVLVKHRLLDGSYAFGFVAYKIFSEHVLHAIHFAATSVLSVFIEQQLSYYSLNNPKKFVPLYIWSSVA
jgi:hypothetical protein